MYAVVIRYNGVENPDRLMYKNKDYAHKVAVDVTAKHEHLSIADEFGTFLYVNPDCILSASVQDINLSMRLNSDLQQLQAMEEIRFKQELGNKAALRGVDINAPRKM